MTTYLVDVSSSIVEHTKHGNQSIGGSIGASDVRARRTNTMHVEADATGRLGDQSALLECVINVLDGVPRHGQQEATGELGPRCRRIKHVRRSVSE